MWVRVQVNYNLAKITVLLLMVLLGGCNTIKKVAEDELLLTRNTIYVDGERTNDDVIKNLIVQKPNTNLLGYPLRLNLYNLAKDDPDSLYNDWLQRKEKREKRLNGLLSKKQVNRLGQSFIVKGFSEFLKRVGEPPVIIDTVNTRKSTELLKSYYGSKGYFNSTAAYSIAQKKKKKGTIDYEVTLGKPYIIDSLTHTITSAELDSIYLKNKEASFVRHGKQFDLSDFSNERSRLTSIYRNTGVYNFQESSITYDIVRDTTVSSDDQKMDVRLNIRRARSDDSTRITAPYKVHKFKRINIYADYDVNTDVQTLDSIQHENYTIFFKDGLKYKPDALTDAVFLEKDTIYRELDKIRTYRQIGNLNTFKYPNILISEYLGERDLIGDIYLAPRPKYSLEVDLDVTHSSIQRVGSSFGVSVVTRNVFGGAETLNVSARGAIGLLSDVTGTGTFTSELGGDINITFPRIWFPFNTEKIIPYYMLPQSRLSVGTNFQKNIGLDRQSLNTILSYNWSPTNFLKNNLELMNIEFVRNTNEENFFNEYRNTFQSLDDVADKFDGVIESPNDPEEDFPELAELFEPAENPMDPLRLSIPNGANGFINAVTQPNFPISADDLGTVRSIRERQTRLTENNLIFASNYTFTKNNKIGINDLDFYQLRLKIESAGNLLSLTTNFIDFEQRNNQSLVFGVPFSQYIKTELDYIKHWQTTGTDVLAFRSFFGLAIPYGNSNNIPFVRSYFAGGSNDNRAWNAYELGPGSTANLNDFNEANLKLALNLEYRFPIFGDFKGAFFADAGNIWNVFDSEDNPDAIFSGFDSLGDIALGSGFGLRYDFTYFVFRLDTGFKTYNPAEEPAKRWFRQYNFRNAVFNVGINYPF